MLASTVQFSKNNQNQPHQPPPTTQLNWGRFGVEPACHIPAREQPPRHANTTHPPGTTPWRMSTARTVSGPFSQDPTVHQQSAFHPLSKPPQNTRLRHGSGHHIPTGNSRRATVVSDAP
jgi:hypothetical protein